MVGGNGSGENVYIWPNLLVEKLRRMREREESRINAEFPACIPRWIEMIIYWGPRKELVMGGNQVLIWKSCLLEDMSSRWIGTQEKAGEELRVFKSESSEEDLHAWVEEWKIEHSQSLGPPRLPHWEGKKELQMDEKKARPMQSPEAKGRSAFKRKTFSCLKSWWLRKTGLVKICQSK